MWLEAMSHVTRTDKRTIPVPEELQALTRDLMTRLGPVRAGKHLGISRNAVLGVVATAHALPGTVALLREAQGRRG
jgi:hypothetical protein